MLFGRDLERWNEFMENRRFFFSSLGLTVSVVELLDIFSGVVVNVVVRERVALSSGSSRASRDDIEFDRELGACITTTSACGLQEGRKALPIELYIGAVMRLHPVHRGT
jgi:hypothetical protein